jgi:AcrR family transcriptional regulator
MSSTDRLMISIRSTPTRPPRGSLSREQVAQAALAFIERNGPEALSMRRLAADLEVGTMTIYGYFRDKDELLDAVVDAATAQIEVPSRRGTWKSQIRALMEQIRTTLADHPIGILLRLNRPMWSPGALRISEAGVRILREAGFSRAEAARAYRSLFSYTFGFAAFTPREVSKEVRRQALAALAALPQDQYPALIESSPELADAVGGEAQFHHGLDLLLDGLEAKLKAGTDRASR